MQRDLIQIIIPHLPPKALSPNAGKQQNIHKLNRISLEAQTDVMARVFEQGPRRRPVEGATVTVEFVVPNQRRRDKDNLIAASKPYLDGLVKAGVIPDDNWMANDIVYPPVIYSKGVSQTIITVRAPD